MADAVMATLAIIGGLTVVLWGVGIAFSLVRMIDRALDKWLGSWDHQEFDR